MHASRYPLGRLYFEATLATVRANNAAALAATLQYNAILAALSGESKSFHDLIGSISNGG